MFSGRGVATVLDQAGAGGSPDGPYWASDMLEAKLAMRTKGSAWTMPKQSGIRLAKRLDEVGFSDIVQIRNKVMELRAAGQQVHALHGGEPYFETPEPIKYSAVKALVENFKGGKDVTADFLPRIQPATVRFAAAAKVG